MLKLQGLSLRSLWKQRLISKGGAAVEPLLYQLRLRRWRWQMAICTTNNERELGRLGSPARTGPEARLLGAGDQPAIQRRILPPSRRWLSGG